MIAVTTEMIYEVCKQIDIALKHAQGKRPQDLAAMTDPRYLWSVLHYMMYNTENNMARHTRGDLDGQYRDRCLEYDTSNTDLEEF